jgi:nitrilase
VIVYADLDLAHASRERYAMDIVGHYNRPDIFDLTVDTRKRPQISWLADPAETQAHDDAVEIGE